MSTPAMDGSEIPWMAGDAQVYRWNHGKSTSVINADIVWRMGDFCVEVVKKSAQFLWLNILPLHSQ